MAGCVCVSVCVCVRTRAHECTVDTVAFWLARTTEQERRGKLRLGEKRMKNGEIRRCKVPERERMRDYKR